jgi:cytochrome c oxidase subunit 3
MMTQSIKSAKTHQDPEYVINPKKFVLWLLIVASVMLFAGFTSAYIVRHGEGNWRVYELPSLFTTSTIVIALSSIFMQWAYLAAKKDELGQIKIALGITLSLGICFGICQWFAYGQLVQNNVYFTGNPSESFVYIISFMHLMHMVGGVIFVLVTFIKSLRLNVHKKSLLTINLCNTYWHFLGILWVYLFIFFQLNR